MDLCDGSVVAILQIACGALACPANRTKVALAAIAIRLWNGYMEIAM